MITKRWQDIQNKLFFAFQPIVNIHTGITFGFEALLRGCDKAGFKSVFHLLDEAYSEKALYSLDLALRKKAVEQFIKIDGASELCLFYNLDNRVLQMPDYLPGNTHKILSDAGFNPDRLFFELSEKHEISCCRETLEILSQYRRQNYHLVLDDFGTGYSGLRSLYDSQPEIIKIDRFFIADIDSDKKKRVFVTNVVDMAHLMGIKIIAEGVESIQEYFVCREIGCDLVQGFLVQKPTHQTDMLLRQYSIIQELSRQQKRSEKSCKETLHEHLKVIEPIFITTPMEEVLAKFKANPEIPYFPIIKNSFEPIGLISDRSLKNFVYSPFGISILRNKNYGEDIRLFIDKVPVLESTTRIEKILEHHAIESNADALIITEEGRYLGILSASSLIQLLYEKEIAAARDQNPLSKLPGNNIINEVISTQLNDTINDTAFVYFDFDAFKPFNDFFGFRQGDRVIILFADMLREMKNRTDCFIGHIGGDDFVLITQLKGNQLSWFIKEIRTLISRFNSNVRMFYNKNHLNKGYMTAIGRDGEKRKYPLLTVSAGVLYFQSGAHEFTPIKLSRKIATLKKKAKTKPGHVSYALVGEPENKKLVGKDPGMVDLEELAV